MAREVFKKLRERIGQHGYGFWETESGVEIKVLERLFTEEEAEMYLNLSAKLQTARAVSEKTGRSADEVEEILQRMMKKGQIFPRFPKEEGEPFYYAAAPWAHGIWEHNARNLDKETAEMILKLFGLGISGRRKQASVRTIPVNATISDPRTLLPFDDIKSIVLSKSRFAVTDCACYDTHRIAGESCDQRKEVCMMFDFYADYYVALGKGRHLTRDEALALLEDCKKDGLAHSIPNCKNPDFICNCCSDCCVVLTAYKKIPNPASVALSSYYTRVDADLCSGCETCLERCPMEAVTVESDNIANINPDRCIGCGVCVSTCPEEALILHKKPEEKCLTPPDRTLLVKPSKEMEDSRFL